MIVLDDVRAARHRLEGVAHRTPVLTSRTLDERTGAPVFLKAETFQRGGAFKFRGAYNKISSLRPEERSRGVIAFSSGNHAQAVALAAKILDVPAVLVMPEDAPVAKRRATEEYGATIVTYDRYTADREQLATQLAADRGLVLVPPYDDPFIIAGQGTVALELLEDAGHLDILVVPVGGGGLVAGCAVACRAQSTTVRIFGVEPELGDDTRRSLRAGEPVQIPVPRTIADGQQVTQPGRMTFEINRRHLEDVVLVSDDEILEAMEFAFDRLKLVTEPSGATGIAALLQGRVDVDGARVGLIVSGGNVGVHRFCELLSNHQGLQIPHGS
nr:threo-3-hydroxy-L-aspartate ammonia-lyase [Actinomycetota bacterium]